MIWRGIYFQGWKLILRLGELEEDDPRFPMFATSPYQEKGGVEVDEPHRATQPVSAMGRAVYPQVHREIMFRVAEDKAHNERLGREFPKSFIEGRNPKG